MGGGGHGGKGSGGRGMGGQGQGVGGGGLQEIKYHCPRSAQTGAGRTCRYC